MSDKLYRIKLQGTADTQQWLAAQQVLKGIDEDAHKFLDTLKLGAGIDIGGKIVESIAEIPRAFHEALKSGVELNTQIEANASAIRDMVQQFIGLDEVSSRLATGNILQQIEELAPQVDASVENLKKGFIATISAAQAAGISTKDNIKLLGEMSNVLSAAKIPASQLGEEMRKILTGNIRKTDAVSQLIHIDNADIEKAIAAGDIVELLHSKFGKLGEGTDSAERAFKNLGDRLDAAKVELSRPLFELLVQGAKELAHALEDPAIKESLKRLGVDVAAAAQKGLALIEWALKNSDALIAVAKAAVEVGAALGALELLKQITRLGVLATQWALQTSAITASTGALALNTEAQLANNAAKGAAGASGVAGALPGVSSLTTSAQNAGAQAGGVLATSFGQKATGALTLIVGNLGAVIAAGIVGWNIGKMIDEAFNVSGKIADLVNGEAAAAQAEFAKPSRAVEIRTKLSLAKTPQEIAEAKRLAGITIQEMSQELQTLSRNKPTAVNLGLVESLKTEIALSKSYIRNAGNLAGTFVEVEGPDGKLAAVSKAEALKLLEEQAKRAAEAQDKLSLALLKAKAAAGDSQDKIIFLKEEYRELIKKFEEGSGIKIDFDVDKGSVADLTKIIGELSKDHDGKLLTPDQIKLIEDAAGAFKKVADERQKIDDDIAKAQEQQHQNALALLDIERRLAAAKGDTATAERIKADLEKQKLADALVKSGAIPKPGDAANKAGQVIDAENKQKADADLAKLDLAQKEEALTLGILTAKAGRREKEAEALEDQLKILKEQQRLQSDLKLSAEDALAKAREKVRLERAASDAEKRTAVDDALGARAALLRNKNKPTGGLAEFDDLQKRSTQSTFGKSATASGFFLSADQRDRRGLDVLSQLAAQDRAKRESRFPVAGVGAFGLAPGPDSVNGTGVTPDGNNPGAGLQNLGNTIAGGGRTTEQKLTQVYVGLNRITEIVSGTNAAHASALDRVNGAIAQMERKFLDALNDTNRRFENDRY